MASAATSSIARPAMAIGTRDGVIDHGAGMRARRAETPNSGMSYCIICPIFSATAKGNRSVSRTI